MNFIGVEAIHLHELDLHPSPTVGTNYRGL
jgi:hypothetical protein